MKQSKTKLFEAVSDERNGWTKVHRQTLFRIDEELDNLLAEYVYRHRSEKVSRNSVIVKALEKFLSANGIHRK